MKRQIAFLTLAAGAVIAATALAVPPERDYEGRVEGDPATMIGFNVKGSGDSRKVKAIIGRVPARCYNGKGGIADVIVEGSLKVDDEGRFGGKLNADFEEAPFKFKFNGRLRTGGKARGTLSTRGTFEGTTCYTGTLKWRATKGADVDPADPF